MIDLTNYSALNARAEVGITLLKAHRGKGLGSQALQLLEMFAVQRLRIHTLYASISPYNKRHSISSLATGTNRWPLSPNGNIHKANTTIWHYS